jgi:NCAIR mutase (PurE)-related protein
VSGPDHRIDLQRRQRLGMVEAIWGESKSAEQIAAIVASFHAASELALATRVEPAKAQAVIDLLPEIAITHHREARCLTAGAIPPANADLGTVAVLGGGTSDLTVVAEAQLALACHGIASERILDVGVAGLHRLLERLPDLATVEAVIACAGMEGALATVIAGLVPLPVIGVPVAVGYGVSAGGMAALNGMLASCAPGLTVVNIDNGYGAAMAALRILGRPN